ncbi:hypothetical protein [Burkholderia sp. AW49-1]
MITFVQPTDADLNIIIGSIEVERGDAFNEDLADDTQDLTLLINAYVTIKGTEFNLVLEGASEDDRDTLGFYTGGQGKQDDQDELRKAVSTLFGEAEMERENTPATVFWNRLCEAIYDAAHDVWSTFTDEVYASANRA